MSSIKLCLMINLELSGGQVILYTAYLAFLTISIIIALRFYLNRTSQKGEGSNRTLRSRTKNPTSDEMRWTGLLFRYGLLVAISFSFFAFSWSISDAEEYTLIFDDGPDEAEVTPPITHFKKQKPLPPPPPPENIIVSAEEINTQPKYEYKKPVLDVPPGPNVDTVGYQMPMAITPPPPPTPKIIEKEPIVLIVAEQMPRFPGCEDMVASFKDKENCANKELLKYLYDNIKYPNIAKENMIEGTAVVRFTVDKSGTIKDIKILRDPGAGLGQEAVRVVKSMNHMGQKWTPGKQRGKAVSVLFTLPISFKLK